MTLINNPTPLSERAIGMIVEYDGTDYCGWQMQPNGPSVQEAMETAIERMTGDRTRVTAAGRTDAGVHARGQVVRFMTRHPWPAKAFIGGLNSRLPDDIGVREAFDAPPDFDPRRDAVRRVYVYRLWNRRTRPVLGRRLWTHYPAPLDFKRIRQASERLLGEQDFRGFRSVHCSAERTRRTLERLDWNETAPGCWEMTIACRSFLHNMVRIIVGTLIDIGRGAKEPEIITRILKTGDRTLGGKTARPEGLCLEDVEYPFRADWPLSSDQKGTQPLRCPDTAIRWDPNAERHPL